MTNETIEIPESENIQARGVQAVQAAGPAPASLGQKTMAGSFPVVLPSDQTVATTNTNIGAQADASATSDTGTFSLIALFKRLLGKFSNDSTDRIRVSLYGKSTAAGDTAISTGATGVLRAAPARTSDGLESAFLTSNGDNIGVPQGFTQLALQYSSGVSSWDRLHNNITTTPLVSSASTVATRTSADQTNYNGSRLIARLNISALAGTPTFTLYLDWKTASGAYIPIWHAAAAAAANGDFTYALGPGSVDAGDYTAAQAILLPRIYRWRVVYAGNGTTDAATTILDVENVL